MRISKFLSLFSLLTFQVTTLVIANPLLPAKSEAEKQGVAQVNEAASSENPLKASLAPSPLKIVETQPAASSKSIEVATEQSSDEANNAWRLDQDNPHRPHITLAIGYVNSNWKKFSGNLKNGSLVYDIGFERQWHPAIEGGLHISFMGPATDSTANENLSEFHVAMHSRYLLMPGKMRPFVGMGIGVGTYRIWSLKSETSASISYNKHSEGAILGLFPEIGMRFVLTGHSFFDLSGGYSGFLDHPRSRIGGANILLRFGFNR